MQSYSAISNTFNSAASTDRQGLDHRKLRSFLLNGIPKKSLKLTHGAASPKASPYINFQFSISPNLLCCTPPASAPIPTTSIVSATTHPPPKLPLQPWPPSSPAGAPSPRRADQLHYHGRRRRPLPDPPCPRHRQWPLPRPPSNPPLCSHRLYTPRTLLSQRVSMARPRVRTQRHPTPGGD